MPSDRVISFPLGASVLAGAVESRPEESRDDLIVDAGVLQGDECFGRDIKRSRLALDCGQDDLWVQASLDHFHDIFVGEAVWQVRRPPGCR